MSNPYIDLVTHIALGNLTQFLEVSTDSPEAIKIKAMLDLVAKDCYKLGGIDANLTDVAKKLAKIDEKIEQLSREGY